MNTPTQDPEVKVSAHAVTGKLLICLLGLMFFSAVSARGQGRLVSRTMSEEEETAQVGPALQQYVRLSVLNHLPAKLSTAISLHLRAATLEEALQRIAAKAGLKLVYDREALSVGKAVTLNREAMPVGEAFKNVLRGTGLGLVLSYTGRLIVVARPEVKVEPQGIELHLEPVKISATALASLRPPVQTGTIAGTVTDSTSGEPLPGVNVVIAGTQRGASTDGQGRFVISDLDPGAYALVASFVGYATKRIEGVDVVADDTTRVNIALNRTQVGLDEVVVVGYGTRQRRDLTGSVSSIEAENINRIPVTSPAELLQGRAAGVRVVSTSGAPGASHTVRIRGTASIKGGNQPLYVVDGMPIGGDLSTINSYNIASIEILKGPSATAIYGARGASGVVLITTKRGRRGQSRVNFNAYYGVQQVEKKLDLLNATQYARLVNDAYRNADIEAEAPYENPEALGEGTDWQDKVFRTAPVQNYQLNFSGGDEDTRYFLSGGYYDQQGIIINSGFKRYSLRVNLDQDVSERFRIGNSLALSRSVGDIIEDNNSNAGSGVIAPALIAPPTVPVFNENGEYNLYTILGRRPNPVARAKLVISDENENRLIGNVFAEYELLDGLTAKASLGVDFLDTREEHYTPSTAPDGYGIGGAGRIGTRQSTTWLYENTLTFDRTFGDQHDLTLLGGFTLQSRETKGSVSSARGFVNDKLTFNGLESGTEQSTRSFSRSSTLASVILRANYIFDDRYLLTFTTRADASSKFGANNKWGFFPSAALAWRVSNEQFMEDVDFISNLKIRASAGVTGNQRIGIYQSLAALYPTTLVFGPDIVHTGFFSGRVANPALRWEKTTQYDVGLDLALFQGRLTFTADAYYKRTTDLLMNLPLPETSGYTSALTNIGSTENRGFELAVNYEKFAGDFTWNVGANFSMNRNEVLDLGKVDEIIGPEGGARSFSLRLNPTILREGEPIGAIYGFIFDGIWQLGEAVEAARYGAEPGDPRLRDLNGDGKISGLDRTIIGYAAPSFTGGLNASIAYKGFDLSVFLQGAYGNDIFNMQRYRLEDVAGRGNQLATVLDRWTPENPSNTIPRVVLGRSPLGTESSRFLEDGSYLRIGSLTLGYRVPADRIGLGFVRHLRIYAAAKNLVTFTGYSSYSPDVSMYGQSALAQGYDFGSYPSARTFTLGVNLGF